MKVADAPDRKELIAWCRERSEANRRFNGKLSQHDLVLIRKEWPVYFDAIAYLLDRDAPKPTGEHQ